VDLAALSDNQTNSPEAGRRPAGHGAPRPSRDVDLGSAAAPVVARHHSQATGDGLLPARSLLQHLQPLFSAGTEQIMFESDSTNGWSNCHNGSHV
jgi:hypothetical protein